jgi:flagellar motor switch protein FliN/FliY
MNISVKKVALANLTAQEEGPLGTSNYLSLVHNLEVQCSVRIGTINMTIGQLKDLKAGQALHLQEKTNDPVEIVLNNHVLAKAELMSHEDQFALRILEVLEHE